MIRRLIAALVLCGVLTFLLFQFYHFLKKRIATSDLKAVTEKRISALLKAPVHVNQISVGLLKHISLSGLEINQKGTGRPVLIGINKIVVRYDLFSFLKRNFRIPAEIFLDSPRLTLGAFQDPQNLLDLSFLKSNRGILTRFEFEGGQVELPWVREDEKLRLEDFEGQAVPKKGDRFDVRFKARLSGVASGSLLSYGEINLSEKKYHLELNLDRVAFSDESGIPVRDLKGKVEWENDTLKIRETRFLFRGIPCELSGEVRRAFSDQPAYVFSFSLQEKSMTVRVDAMIDFKTHVIEGAIQTPFEKYRFLGSVQGKPADFQMTELAINDIYQASGRFDSKNRTYEIKWGREGERYEAAFSMGDFLWILTVKLDHYQFFDFDVVTSAVIRLVPDDGSWREGEHVFQAEMKTDYFIFQYHPLRDFQATAKLSARGIDDLLARWGQVSELRGRLTFEAVPKTEAVLRIASLELNALAALGIHPLPSSLEGTFEGQLEIKGPLENPSLNGAFAVSKGSIGSFKYDQASMNFSGRLPYLILNDSKVWVGKNAFKLSGGLDFRLGNFFEGIKIESSENIVLWRGLELSSSLKEVPVEQLRSGAGAVARVEADYKLTDRSSLRVTAEEDQSNKEYVAAGPKLKF